MTDIKKIQISNIWVLAILNEMATELIAQDIDSDFYDGYMFNDISWLVKNKNKIAEDFYNNIDKMSFALKNRCKNIKSYDKEVIQYGIEYL